MVIGALAASFSLADFLWFIGAELPPVGAVLSIVFVGNLRKSVTGVTGLAVHLADGDLRQDKLIVQSSDELGQLARILNKVLDRLRDNVAQTRAAAESLTGPDDHACRRSRWPNS